MDTRRTFLGSFLSFLGLEAADDTPIKNPRLKGFLIHTVNVGLLPPYKAEAFAERLKDQLVKRRSDPGWQIVVIPVRPPQETKLEVVVYDGDEASGRMEAKRLRPFEILAEELGVIRKQTIPPKEQTKDYVLLMLGAPVVKIEIDEQQLDMCYEMAVKEVIESQWILSPSHVNRGALAFAKVILGRIRRFPLIGKGSLLSEGRKELKSWRKEIA